MTLQNKNVTSLMLTSMMDEPLLLRSSVCVVGGAENAN